MKRVCAAVILAERKLEFREFDLPDIGSDDGLLRVEATGICGTDWSLYLGKLGRFGINFPVIPGHEVVGRIARVGKEAAKRWGVKEGDRVVVEAIIPCGRCELCLSGNYRICDAHLCYGLYLPTTIPPSLWGGYSQYMYLHPNSMLHKISEDVSPEEAALFVPLSNGIRWAHQVPGTGIGATVIIQGPGQQGLGCVIGAKEAGASCIIVTGLTKDAKRLALARELGAHYTINAQEEDVVERVREITGGEMCDVVIDTSDGAVEPVVLSVDLAKKRGVIILAGTKHFKPVDRITIDKIIAKELTLKGVLTHDFRAVRPALRIIESRRYPLWKMATHKFPLEKAEIAIKTVGREVGEEDPIHVTILC